MNLSDDGDGMVPINLNPSTAFKQEKNVSEHHKETIPMDSTPINDIMMDPPAMNDEPRMQGMLSAAAHPQGAYQGGGQGQGQGYGQGDQGPSKNPMNLTDDQMMALVVLVSTALAVSKPVQDRLATSIPKFLNEQGGRSVVGLASTGVIAAIVFYFVKDYVVKP